MPPIGQYRVNHEFTKPSLVRNAPFTRKPSNAPKSMEKKRPSCSSYTSDDANCNLHSRKVVKLKAIQQKEKAVLLEQLDNTHVNTTGRELSVSETIAREAERKEINGQLNKREQQIKGALDAHAKVEKLLSHVKDNMAEQQNRRRMFSMEKMKPRDENSIIAGLNINPSESRFMMPQGEIEMLSKYPNTQRAPQLHNRGRSELFGKPNP